MKYYLTFLLSFLVIAIMIASCGPSEEEKQRQEQARQDSLEQARKDSLAKVRQDSLAKARADSLAKAEEKPIGDVTFTEQGRFAIQVESWRSRIKAEQRAEMWKERGFDNASVIKDTHQNPGNVWFGVRLGRVESEESAEKVQQQLRQEYQTEASIIIIR